MKKFNKTIYTITAGYIFTSLLAINPSQADEIEASFDRDLNHTMVTGSVSSLLRENNLPEQSAVNRMVWSQEKDPVSESFNRNLNHKIMPGHKLVIRETDSVAALIRKFLSIQRANEISMSVARK